MWNRTRSLAAACSVLSVAALVAVGLVLPAAAQAAAVAKQTELKCYEYKNPTDWGGVPQQLAVEKFNVPGGTLTAVNVDRAVQITSRYTASSQNMGTRRVDISADGWVRMDGNYGLRTLSGTFNEKKSYEYVNGVGTTSDTVADRNDPDKVRLTSPSDLAAWSGAGTNVFTGASYGNSSIVGSGNNGAQINTDALMKVCVMYEYTEEVTVCIGDYIWIDANRNGIQDQGENPVPGMNVRITDHTGALLGTAVTDTSGRWQLCGLEPSVDCYGDVTLPNGYVVTTAFQGAPELDSNGIGNGTGARFKCKTPPTGSDLSFDVGVWAAPQPFAPAIPGASNAVPRSNVLRARKSASHRLINSGGRTIFTVVVNNVSRQALRNVTVCDRPPAQLSFVTRPRGSFFRSGSLCWRVNYIAPRSSKMFRYAMKSSRVASRRCVLNTVSASDGLGSIASARAAVCIKPTARKPIKLAG